MSWEANVWAVKQRMKLPQEQLVLIVLGNCADPDAVAFSKWPGRDHWWKYLGKITRLSRSSLFRHINTIVALGLASRSTIVLSDGSKRPTITLNLEASFDIEHEKERYFEATQAHSRDQSHGETGEDDQSENTENVNDVIELEGENPPIQNESHGDTAEQSPTSGTVSVPPAGLHIESSKSSSKESPPTPSGGSERSDLWDDFLKSWIEPIQRMAITQQAWDRTASDKRPTCIAAAKGFWAWHRAQQKPKTPQSAQSFIRDEAGWQQWLRYVPDANGQISTSSRSHPVSSPEGRAICTLYEIAGCEQALKSFMIRNGAVHYRNPINARLLALADVGPRDSWPVLTRQQASAWETMVGAMVTVQVRRRLREGDRAPHPWPPKVDGTWSPTGPPDPETLMRDEDYANI
jgi:hypothetical protein